MTTSLMLVCLPAAVMEEFKRFDAPLIYLAACPGRLALIIRHSTSELVPGHGQSSLNQSNPSQKRTDLWSQFAIGGIDYVLVCRRQLFRLTFADCKLMPRSV